MDLDWAEELSDMAKKVYCAPNAERPYTDTSPIKQGWTGRFEWSWRLSEWFRPYVYVRFCSGSKNWCMGSLIWDVVFFAFEFGPLDLFFAYRLNISPPRSK